RERRDRLSGQARARRARRGLPPRVSTGLCRQQGQATSRDEQLEPIVHRRPLRDRARLQLAVLRCEAAGPAPPRSSARPPTSGTLIMHTSATAKLFSSLGSHRARDVCTELLASAGVTV